MFRRKYTHFYSYSYLYHSTRANSAACHWGSSTFSPLPHHRLHCAWSDFCIFSFTLAVLFCGLPTSVELGNLHGTELESEPAMTLFSFFVQHAFSHQTNLYSVCILMQIHYLCLLFCWRPVGNAFPCLPFSHPIYHSSSFQSLYLIFALGQTLRTTR